MTAPGAGDPCLEPVDAAALPGGRIRVVEVLATGSNGGAQEHVFGLLTRIDPSRYDVHVVSLSQGSSVRKLERSGIAVTVIDEPDDAIATGALAALLGDIRPEVVHNHMYRAELVGTRAAIALGEIGRPRPYLVSTVHSSRVRSEEDRRVLRLLTPRMDRLIAVSRSIVDKLHAEGRDSVPISLIHNGVDLERYDHQEPCCTLREEYGLPPGAPVVGVVARLEPEKGHPTLIEAWPQVVAARARRDAPRGRGGQPARRARGPRIASSASRERVVFTGRRDDVPAVTAALDVAVLPSYREALGLTILEAMALSRPVVASNVGGIPEMVEDGVTGLLVPPHDADGAGAARSSACCATTRWPTRSGGRATTWSTPSSASSSWSTPSNRSTTTAPGRSGSARSPPDRTIG